MSTSGASAPPVQSTLKFSTVSCGRTSSNIMQGPVEPKPKATSGQTAELAAGVVPMIMRDVSPGAGRIGVIFGAVCHELSPAQNSPVWVTTWDEGTVNVLPGTYGSSVPAMWSESADEKGTSTLICVAEFAIIVPATPPPNVTVSAVGSNRKAPLALSVSVSPPLGVALDSVPSNTKGAGSTLIRAESASPRPVTRA